MSHSADSRSRHLERLHAHHARTRARGVQPLVYWSVRLVLQPLLHLWFRLRRAGREHIPAGGVILASNHRSFLDPFVIGCCVGRPVYFVAKEELFRNRVLGWLLSCMGAFPVRRGAGDEESMETARILIERGEAVVIFPEGTRQRGARLRPPRRGAGRLALMTRAPIVPVAVEGSDRARRGALIAPVRVCIRVGRPLTFPRVQAPTHRLAAEVTARAWTCVELQWVWLGGAMPERHEAGAEIAAIEHVAA